MRARVCVCVFFFLRDAEKIESDAKGRLYCGVCGQPNKEMKQTVLWVCAVLAVETCASAAKGSSSVVDQGPGPAVELAARRCAICEFVVTGLDRRIRVRTCDVDYTLAGCVSRKLPLLKLAHC